MVCVASVVCSVLKTRWPVSAALSAVFYATNPSEFALRVQGVAGTSDASWSGFEQDTTA